MSYSSGEYGRDNIAEEDNHEHQGDFLPVLRLRGGDCGDQDTDQYPAMLCTTRDSLLLHWTTTSKEWRQKV